MLEYLHLRIDSPDFKCSFFSTMKRQLFLLFPGILAAVLFSSCSPTPGPMPSVGAGESASAIPHNGPVPETSPMRSKRDLRPGLATGWGKEKESKLDQRDFVRASSKPAGIDAIYYNDKEGLKAMSSYSISDKPVKTAAGELVEWGIKGRVGFLPSYYDLSLVPGPGRRMITGDKDGTYSIYVKNRSKSALEIVASVDGLDVMDGKAASFSKRGYIVNAGESLTIDGFRTSERSVASFKFSSVMNSYANMRHGDTRNVGVIGLAVFTQKGVDPWTWMPKEVQQRGNARAFAEAP